MRAVVQRVLSAGVTVDGKRVSKIAGGLLVLLGVHQEDTEKDAEYIAGKLGGLRIMQDADGKTNLPVHPDTEEFLVVSQFTLFGDCRKGRRPSFSTSAAGETGNQLYERTVELVRQLGFRVQTGIFGACMEVDSVNSGPYTILLDSRNMITF